MSGRSVARRTTSVGRTQNMMPERSAGARKWAVRSTAAIVSMSELRAVMAVVRRGVPHVPMAGVVGGRMVDGLNVRADGLGYEITFSGEAWTGAVELDAMPRSVMATRMGEHTLSVRPVPPPQRPAERPNMTRGTQA